MLVPSNGSYVHTMLRLSGANLLAIAPWSVGRSLARVAARQDTCRSPLLALIVAVTEAHLGPNIYSALAKAIALVGTHG